MYLATMPNKHYTFYGCNRSNMPDVFFDHQLVEYSSLVNVVDNKFLSGKLTREEMLQLSYEQTYNV